MYVLFNNNNNKNWKKGVFGSSQFICNVFEHVYQFEFSHNSKQFLVLLLWVLHYFLFFHSIFFFQSLFISCFLQNCMLKLFFYHSPNSCRRERGTNVYCSFKSFDIFTLITPIWNSDLLLTKQRQENFLQYCKDSLWMTDWVFSFRMFHIINLPG